MVKLASGLFSLCATVVEKGLLTDLQEIQILRLVACRHPMLSNPFLMNSEVVLKWLSYRHTVMKSEDSVCILAVHLNIGSSITLVQR